MNSGLDLSNGALPAPPLGDETADLGPQLWRSCLEQLAQELPEQQFNTWLKPLTVRVSDDLTQVTVLVATTALVGEDCLVSGSTDTWYKYTPSGFTQFATMNGGTGVWSAPACAACAVTNASNVFTVAQEINLNSHALQSPQTGTLLQLGQANSVATRVELDTYAAVGKVMHAAARP